MKRLVAACLTVAICGLAAAQSQPSTVTWKWRDAGGRVVWSDTPPPASVDGTQGTATAIAASFRNVCAIQTETGGVVCW